MGGLSAAELKAKFDEGGNLIKGYINDSLIPQILADGLAEAQRSAAETARQTAEAARAAAETGRRTAEAQRSAAEQARSLWEDYDPETSYVPGNKVCYLGSSYVNQAPCRGVAPTDAAHWQIIARHGQDGSGRSAYDYAAAGGYTGTEEEFQALMGSGPWIPGTRRTLERKQDVQVSVQSRIAHLPGGWQQFGRVVAPDSNFFVYGLLKCITNAGVMVPSMAFLAIGGRIESEKVNGALIGVYHTYSRGTPQAEKEKYVRIAVTADGKLYSRQGYYAPGNYTDLAVQNVEIFETPVMVDREPEDIVWDSYQSVRNVAMTGASAGAHNGVYRGESLGGAVTADQYAAIAAGTFDDLFIGDYWTIDNVNWRIAAFDYYLNCGRTGEQVARHHAVLVPDAPLYSARMNAGNTTQGAYVGSEMYASGLDRAKSAVKAAFGGHVLRHGIYLNNAVADGVVTDGAWFDSEVELMCEHMVYGSGIFSPVSSGGSCPDSVRLEKTQLPLFRMAPWLLVCKTNWWLRDAISSSQFAFVTTNGNANVYAPSYAFGVRPSFSIC